METYCTEQHYASPTLINMADGSAEVVAGFLIARGPYWYSLLLDVRLTSANIQPQHRFLGYGWQGCSNSPIEPTPLVQMDVGVPVNNCTQVSSGVYARNFTNGYAVLDCNTFTATLVF